MEALSETANTRAFLRKGRYDTTRLSQRRARGPIRRQLAVRCAAQKQARFNAYPINAVSLANYIAKGNFIYRKERFEPRHALTTLQRREAGYPRVHNRHNIYPTTVLSILHADYCQGGQQQSQLAQCLSRLVQCSLFCMQIIVKEGYIAS